jgi:hypothetical protein
MPISFFEKRDAWSMIIRKYRSADCRELSDLFYETVHTVSIRDYTSEQVEA